MEDVEQASPSVASPSRLLSDDPCWLLQASVSLLHLFPLRRWPRGREINPSAFRRSPSMTNRPLMRRSGVGQHSLQYLPALGPWLFHCSGPLLSATTSFLLPLTDIGTHQLPLIFITRRFMKGTKLGNLVFWFSFCILGQPMCILLYTHLVYHRYQFFYWKYV